MLVLWLALVQFGAAAQSVETIERADQSVFRIINSTGGSGTGYLIGSPGYLLTNQHVVGSDRKVFVLQQLEGRNEIFEANVLHRDRERDMAIVHTARLQGDPLMFNSNAAQKGLQVFTLGFPGLADMENWQNIYQFIDILRASRNYTTSSHTKGDISRVISETWDSRSRRMKIIQHTATIRPGNSGGPLMDLCGRIVGMNTAGITGGRAGAATVYLASAASEITQFLDEHGVRYAESGSDCEPSNGSGSGSSRRDRLMMIAIIGLALILLVGILVAIVYRHQLQRIVEHAFKPQRPQAKRRKAPIEDNEASARQYHADLPASGFHDPKPPIAGVDDLALHQDNDGTVWLIRLRGEKGKVRFRVTQEAAQRKLAVGRDQRKVDLLLAEASVSRRHAELRSAGGRLYIEDLGSTNGTFVNGRKLVQGHRHELREGDSLKLGKVKGSVQIE